MQGFKMESRQHLYLEKHEMKLTELRFELFIWLRSNLVWAMLTRWLWLIVRVEIFDFQFFFWFPSRIDSFETIARVLCCNHYPWWFPGLTETFHRTGSNQKSVWSSQLLHLSYLEISKFLIGANQFCVKMKSYFAVSATDSLTCKILDWWIDIFIRRLATKTGKTPNIIIEVFCLGI